MINIKQAFRTLWNKVFRNDQTYPVEIMITHSEENEHDDLREMHFENPRDQLDANEYFEATQSQTESGFQIRAIHHENMTSSKTRRLTPHGLKTEESETMLQSVTGQVIQQEQLLNGGQCHECGGFVDREHFLPCEICGRGTCRLHAYTVDGVWLCADHARQALYSDDMWSKH